MNIMAGIALNDRKLGANVRNLSLRLIEKYLKDETPENDKFRKDLLLKLATNVLPRITQLEGEDGRPIQISISKEIADKNGINSTSEDNS